MQASNTAPNGPVRTEPLQPDSLLPLVIRPAGPAVDLNVWAGANREFIQSSLVRHGALLFRDFDLARVADFESFVAASANEVMEYRERSSPRHAVSDKVYTSTDYPADAGIFPHNEHSYSRTFPLRLYFFCETPARAGGATPIADCRGILSRISPETVARFRRRGWMYVRNFGDGFGLPWPTVFQTTDKGVVEDYCRRNLIEFEWRGDNRLRTRQVRPVIARHPHTGEEVWFNHLTFFHVSTLDAPVRDALLAAFGEEDLPNNTYYGDGGAIEPEVLDELRRAYEQELVSFTWRRGDVIIIDNLLTAHSRTPFAGPRRILFAMADPFTRTDI